LEIKKTISLIFVLVLKPIIKTHIKGYFRGKEKVLAVLGTSLERGTKLRVRGESLGVQGLNWERE